MLAEIWPDIIALVLTFITIFGFSLLFSTTHRSSVETIESQVSSHLIDVFIADLLETDIEYKNTNVPIAQALGIYFENKDEEIVTKIDEVIKRDQFKQSLFLVGARQQHCWSAYIGKKGELTSGFTGRVPLTILFQCGIMSARVSVDKPMTDPNTKEDFRDKVFTIPSYEEGKVLEVIVD